MERPCKRSKINDNSSSDTNNNNTDPIPTDIVTEILQKLPAKSVMKFVIVSKSWAKIIRSNYFINSFSLRRSMEFQMQQEPHHLLFAFNEGEVRESQDNWSFFSSSSVNLATDNNKPPLEFISRLVPRFHGRSRKPIYLKGLLNFIFGRTQVISNPSTGKSIVLPPIKSRREIYSRYFGFDPIKGEHKVLCIINPIHDCGIRIRIPPFPNQILTVGSNNLWLEIDVWIPHRPHHSAGVCINGVIYYLAYELDKKPILVRFDVRSEKFLKQLPCFFLQPFWDTLVLINYESKLAIVHKIKDLWVLEDGKKLEWLKLSHDISPWRHWITGYDYDREILGTTLSGEIVYTCYYNGGFYVIYQDHKKKQHRKVQITPNVNIYQTSLVYRYGFIDYVESVMLL